MLQDVDLDTVVAERPGLVEAERLEIAGDHLHRRHPRRLPWRLTKSVLLFEGGLSASPEAEALGVGKAGNGGGPGSRDIHDAGIGQCVLKPQSGAALLGGCDLSARALGPGGVGHGVGLIEHDDAFEGMARVFIHPASEPADDLIEPRGSALSGRRAQCRVGGEQDMPALLRDLGALAKLAQGDHVVLAAAERCPVAACVFQQLVGLRQPQRPHAALEAVVQDDGGDLAALSAACAVAQHPAAPELRTGAEGCFGVVLHVVAVWAVVAGHRRPLSSSSRLSSSPLSARSTVSQSCAMR